MDFGFTRHHNVKCAWEVPGEPCITSNDKQQFLRADFQKVRFGEL
jgi:hypothetical protein